MKKYFIIIILLYTTNGFCQNLVQNPSFEEYYSCPDDYMQIDRCKNWSTFGNSVDFFSQCPGAINWPYIALSPPTNGYLGYQYPRSGYNIVGLYTYIKYSFFREYIGNTLLSALIAGKKYYISFYVSASCRENSFHTTMASNKMGVRFSTVPYSDFNPPLTNNTAHYYSNIVITDTLNWTKISGSFIADSAYSYLIIGNFFDDMHTDTMDITPPADPARAAYYFIDDVCVSLDSLYCNNWLNNKEQSVKKEDIEIYPNPCINKLNVKFNNMPSVNPIVSIIDITGKTILQTYTTDSKLVFNTEKLAKGLYLIKIESEDKIMTQKFTKE